MQTKNPSLTPVLDCSNDRNILLHWFLNQSQKTCNDTLLIQGRKRAHFCFCSLLMLVCGPGQAQAWYTAVPHQQCAQPDSSGEQVCWPWPTGGVEENWTCEDSALKKSIKPSTTQLERSWNCKVGRKIKMRCSPTLGKCSHPVCKFSLYDESEHKVCTVVEHLDLRF